MHSHQALLTAYSENFPYVLTRLTEKYDYRTYKITPGVYVFEGLENDPPPFWAYIINPLENPELLKSYEN
jgi:hypothetical protein